MVTVRLTIGDRTYPAVDLCAEHRAVLEQYVKTLPPGKRKPEIYGRGNASTTTRRGRQPVVYDSPEDIP